MSCFSVSDAANRKITDSTWEIGKQDSCFSVSVRSARAKTETQCGESGNLVVDPGIRGFNLGHREFKFFVFPFRRCGESGNRGSNSGNRKIRFPVFPFRLDPNAGKQKHGNGAGATGDGKNGIRMRERKNARRRIGDSIREPANPNFLLVLFRRCGESGNLGFNPGNRQIRFPVFLSDQHSRKQKRNSAMRRIGKSVIQPSKSENHFSCFPVR